MTHRIELNFVVTDNSVCSSNGSALDPRSSPELSRPVAMAGFPTRVSVYLASRILNDTGGGRPNCLCGPVAE